MRRAIERALVRYVGDAAEAVTAGATVVLHWGEHTLVREARGFAQLQDCGRPLRRKLDLETRFDLASITKVLVTTAAVMRLVGDGRLELRTRVGELLPGFRGSSKDDITLAHLLAHEAGLPAWAPVYLHARNPDRALAWVVEQPLVSEPGRRHAYSDLGFMLLGAALEVVTGYPLPELFRREVAEPLGLLTSGYRPRATDSTASDDASWGPAVDLAPEPGGTIAATSCGDRHEQRMIATGQPYPVEGDPDTFDDWRHHTLVGEANDGNAWHAFGGVAGHAGAFGTVDDVGRLGRALLAGLCGEDNPLAPPGVAASFCASTGRGRQALGWWRDPGDARAGGRLVGHSGFTGGRMAVDEVSHSVLVLLANRQQLGPPHPDVTPLWRELVAALPDGPPA